MGASATGRRPLLFFAVSGFAVLALDQAAKALAVAFLHPHQPQAVLGGAVRLTLVRNPGTAFGIIAAPLVPILATLAVCVAVGVYAGSGRLSRSPARALPLGLILGGAVGNLADRIRLGAVVDYIDLQVWPVFNLADAAITVGIGLLALQFARRR